MAAPSLSQIASDLLAPNNFWGASQITFSFPGASAAWPGYPADGEQADSHYAGLSASQISAMPPGTPRKLR